MTSHGSVKTDSGVIVNLTQEAYCNNYGQYLASGKDSDGNVYLVEWETTLAWDEAQKEMRDTGECSAFAEDESNACLWDDPVSITLVQEA